MPQTLLPNILDFISQIDPFDKLPSMLQRKIATSIKITYLGRGEQIHFNADIAERYLYIVRTGSMEQRQPNGVLRAKLGAEDLFGFTLLESETQAESRYSATAIENTLLYLVPHSQLKQLLLEHPEFSEHFASQAQVRLQSALNVVWSENEKGLFVKTVAEVARGKVAVVSSCRSIRDVAQAMRKAHSSTAVVMEAEQIAGVITDRDMTKRVVAKGIETKLPVSQVMTASPYTIEPEELILKAVSLMMQHNIRSLPVVSNNKVLGLLTTSNLVQNHRVQAIFLIEKIKDADSIETLSRLTSERQAIFEALVEGKVRSEIIGQVMAMIMDAYNRRLIQLAEEKLGPPPCEYAWVVAGSHARNEVHMLSDQDNAIILSDTATASDRMYFNHLAMYVCNGLDACGYPLCTGKYMAASPKWCQPLRIWKEYYRKWVANPEYEMLLNAIVFMEVRVIYGETELSNRLQAYLHQQIATNGPFIGSLVRGTVSVNPPLSIFNNLVVEKSGDNSNTLNIKKYAINLIVDLARIYSLSEGCQLTGTEERLRYVFERQVIAEDSFQDIIGAYRFITQVRFTHQFEALKQGKEPNNHIAPDAFGSFERKHLKDAFRIISNFQDLAKLRFNGE